VQRNFIFNGGASTRYHTATVFNRQTIADHSFGVAWFCELITDEFASKDLIMAALAHDLAEHLVGDIPSPAKRKLGLSKQFQELEDAELDTAGLLMYSRMLGEPEQQVLKIADCMEGLMYCLKERRLGNKNVEIIFERFCQYITDVVSKMTVGKYRSRAANLHIQIVEEWEGVIGDVR
jgi:5'-deoxynucleotidase YfbR-like HD superfamily hydrolase